VNEAAARQNSGIIRFSSRRLPERNLPRPSVFRRFSVSTEVLEKQAGLHYFAVSWTAATPLRMALVEAFWRVA
jgi:hypothetical protein